MTAMPQIVHKRWVREPQRLHFPVEECVPESKLHLELRTLLYQLLKRAFGDRAIIGSDQFVYWDPTDPAACPFPDVFVRLGGRGEIFDSWKVWERGAPHIAVEIISRSDSPDAAWETKLGRYHRLGVSELVRFDPEDGKQPLRVWDYVEGDLVERSLDAPRSAACGLIS